MVQNCPPQKVDMDDYFQVSCASQPTVRLFFSDLFCAEFLFLQIFGFIWQELLLFGHLFMLVIIGQE